jgi:hypothetical protein
MITLAVQRYSNLTHKTKLCGRETPAALHFLFISAPALIRLPDSRLLLHTFVPMPIEYFWKNFEA